MRADNIENRCVRLPPNHNLSAHFECPLSKTSLKIEFSHVEITKVLLGRSVSFSQMVIDIVKDPFSIKLKKQVFTDIRIPFQKKRRAIADNLFRSLKTLTQLVVQRKSCIFEQPILCFGDLNVSIHRFIKIVFIK